MVRSGERDLDLAGESSRQLGCLLERQDKRSRKVRKLSASNERKKEVQRSVCGASAIRRDEKPSIFPNVEKKTDEETWEDVEEADAAEVDNKDAVGVVVALSKEDAAPSSESKKKRRSQTFTKQDRMVCLEIHRTHLLFLLARGLSLSSAADDLLLQSVALSLVPATVDLKDPREVVQVVRDCFGGALKPVTGDPEGVDGNVVERLEKGTELNVEQMVVLSAALLRGIGIPTRIMWALEPIPLRPEDVVKQQKGGGKEQKKSKRPTDKLKDRKTMNKGSTRQKAPRREEEPNGVTNEPKRKFDIELEQATAMAMEVSSWAVEMRQEGKDDAVRDVSKPSPSLDPSLSTRYWLELYLHDKGSWETLHIVPPPVPLIEPYVIAFNGHGAKDLTKKYCMQEHLARITPLRDESWWSQTMSSHRRAETAALRASLEKHKSSVGDNAATLVAKASEHEDNSIVAKEERARREVPTTIKGFQKHEQFILKRHIKTHEVLTPGAQAVGMVKGEPYYNRSDVCVVHTAEKWKRQGRIVKESELNKPVKLIKKRGAQQSEADLEYLDPSSTQQLMSSFYGPWQTVEWEMPSAKDGIVPKNEWGSVEIPPLAHALPGGTAHVDLPDAAKVCRQIGIDFADAVSGFDYKKRRMVPTKRGVVVCAENEELLRNAWSEFIRHEQQVAKEKRLLEGEAAWRDLLAAALTHIRVHQSFADNVEAALLEHASMKNDILPRGLKDSRGNKATGEASPEDNLVTHEVEEI